MGVYLFDNAAGNWSISSAAGSPGYQLGNAFKATQSGYAHALRWMRYATGSGYGCHDLSIWDTTNSTRIAHIDVPSDDGNAGWQTSTLPDPVALVANRVYIVAMSVVTGEAYPYRLTSTATPPYPLAWDTNYQAYNQAVEGNYPGLNRAAGNVVGVDLLWDMNTSVSDLPVTPVYLDTQLGAYFDPESATVTLGSNYTYPDAVDELISRLGGASANWAGTVTTIINAIKDQTDLLPAGIATLTNAWLADLLDQATNANDLVQQIVAGTAGTRVALDGGGSAFGPTYDQVDAIGGQVAQLLADGEQLAGYADFPGAPWTMSDEQAFDTNLAYAEPAHLYVVSFSDLGSNVVNTVVSGVDVSYRLAWWTPLAGANAHQRRFIDTPSAHLYDNGHKMPGILLCSQAGGSGTIQAWSRF